MFLLIRGPMGHCEEISVASAGMSLGTLLPYKLELVLVNGQVTEKWQDYIPQRGDRVEVTCGAGLFGAAAGGIAAGISAGVGGAISAATVAAILNAVVAITLSTALSAVMRALTPKPKKPKQAARAEAFGISGFNNTTGPGTPKFTPYGLNKVRGHVIASGANLSPDGTQMYGRILYFMGWMGDDGCQSIGNIEIDGTSIDQFEEVHVHTRLGVNPQAVIPEFENVDNIFTPTVSTLDFNPDTSVGTPIIYTTKSATVQRVTLFFSFPAGLYRVGDTGKTRQAGVAYNIERKLDADSTWVQVDGGGDGGQLRYFEQNTSGMFHTFQIDLPTAGKWNIRITVVEFINYHAGESFIGDSILFNVQETQFTTRSYPGWALLGLTNIPSKKVRSFEGMDVSAIMEGKRVKIPDGLGNTTLAYTRQRCWIVRDMMTHPIVGMGYEFSEAEIDDAQWLADAQAYYDEMVLGHDGLEPRDLCDVILNDLDWDWEWIKKVVGEARGRVIPSGDKWKYVIDKPGTPNLLYTEGANIIENSVSQEISLPDRPFSHITAQFRNAEKDYEPDYAPPIADPAAVSAVMNTLQYDTVTRESQVQRENMIAFKRNFLERRRWSFMSPMNAIVSEPMDLDYFAERSLGGEGSYGGFLPAGASTTVVNLPDVITLEPSQTYALIVKHQQDNTTEHRIVNTPAGSWGVVSVTVAFAQAPAEGDVYALGIQTIDHIVTRAQELEIDRDGRVRQVRSEYIPAVYTQDPLPPKSSRRFFGPALRQVPIPLRAASVREEVTVNRDGSVRSILIFDVTPGLAIQSGFVQNAFATAVQLAIPEPDRDDYFNGARVRIIETGNDVNIVDYNGPARLTSVDPPFTVNPVANDTYEIRWEKFGEYGGFRVEQSEDGGLNYFTLGSTAGTHWETDGRGAGPGPVFFRFTPISIEGVENAVARIVLSVVIQGDLSAPAPPISVTVSSYLLNVRVLVKLQKPMAEDFNGVEVEVWRNALDTGTLLETTRFGAPSDNGTGVMQIEATFNLGARIPPEAYGTMIWARARSVDFSQNKSAATDGNGTILTPDPGATGIGIGPPAVPTGLALVTGTQVDPSDGTIKVFLDISWNANTEPDMSRYEVQYRQQGTLPYTVRLISHPQISTREIGLIGNVVYEARIQAIDVANNVSGFSGTVTILSARDTTPPPPPTIFSIVSGFRKIDVFFQPPAASPDFECAQIFVSTVNNVNTASFWGESASKSVQFVISPLQDDTLYYVWLRSRDTSGNVSGFNTGDFAGTTPSNGATVKIGPNDIVTTNLITTFAQIGTAVMDQAYAATLTANKIIGGQVQAILGLGVGTQIYIDGVNGLFWVIDNNSVVRVQLGKLGPAVTDFGLQIFGADASLWHSFTGGTQSKGRQDVNETTAFINITAGNGRSWFSGCFFTRNDTNGITVRVMATGRNSPLKGGGEATFGYQEVNINHFIGKKMTVSVGLTNVFDATDPTFPASQPVTATLIVDYW